MVYHDTITFLRSSKGISKDKLTLEQKDKLAHELWAQAKWSIDQEAPVKSIFSVKCLCIVPKQHNTPHTICVGPKSRTLLYCLFFSSCNVVFLFSLLLHVIFSISILTKPFIYKPNHSCRILTPSISILYRWKTSLLFSFILKLSIHQQLYHHASSTGQLLSIHYTILI